MRKVFIGVLAALLVGVLGCQKTTEKKVEMEKKQEQQPKTEAAADFTMPDINSLELTTTESGLQYADLVEGTGDQPKTGQIAEVHYSGWLTDGRLFDSSKKRGNTFRFKVGVGQVIRGGDEGVASMHVGGKRVLVLPPELAYGERGAGGVIPPNATLVFEVELLGVHEQ